MKEISVRSKQSISRSNWCQEPSLVLTPGVGFSRTLLGSAGCEQKGRDSWLAQRDIAARPLRKINIFFHS